MCRNDQAMQSGTATTQNEMTTKEQKNAKNSDRINRMDRISKSTLHPVILSKAFSVFDLYLCLCAQFIFRCRLPRCVPLFLCGKKLVGFA
jgi:hypothetical protein